MQQFFFVARTQTCQIEFVHKSLVEQHKPGVKAVSLAEDGLSARITLEKLDQGFVYEFDLAGLRSRDKEELLHRNAFYTVNEVRRP